MTIKPLRLTIFNFVLLLPVCGALMGLSANEQSPNNHQPQKVSAVFKPPVYPCMILGNGDTIVFKPVQAGTVLINTDGWRIIMIDTASIAIIQIDSIFKAVSTRFTHPCTIITPPGHQLTIYASNFFNALLNASSSIQFTPGPVFDKPQKNLIELSGSAVMNISNDYVLNTDLYSIEGPYGNIDRFIIEDNEDENYHYIKNIGATAIKLLKPEVYILNAHIRLTNAHQEEQLTGKDLQDFEKRYPELEKGITLGERKNKEILKELVFWYGFKGYRFAGGAKPGEQFAFNGQFNCCQPWYWIMGELNSTSTIHITVIDDYIVLSKKASSP